MQIANEFCSGVHKRWIIKKKPKQTSKKYLLVTLNVPLIDYTKQQNIRQEKHMSDI